jgi:hypothetical protein
LRKSGFDPGIPHAPSRARLEFGAGVIFHSSRYAAGMP